VESWAQEMQDRSDGSGESKIDNNKRVTVAQASGELSLVAEISQEL
jgi:hypothetical protein